MTFTSKQKGFSLIELLVIMAIIGVLTSAGVISYQRYIDSTKADVVKTNAQSISRWVTATGIARQGGILLEPTSCKTTGQNMSTCLTDAATGTGALSSFENPYDTSMLATAIMLDNTTGGDNTTCTNSNYGKIMLLFSAASGSYDHTVTSNEVDVMYCEGVTKAWTLTRKTGITW